ncbi:MAG TPA: hypothetical protein VFD59_08970 [Nocardioidaceae bacterium]|nr:hypothetical protein [Nocardioidaceae bacterium]
MPSRQDRAPVIGLGVALALMVLAMAVPAVTGWNVRINDFPPLHAEWMPRVGYATPAAVALAVLAAWQSHHLARTLRWVPLLLLVFAAGLAWMLALALVDGQAGVGGILTDKYEYLPTARRTTDFGETLDIYASKISYDAEPDNWPVHIAGHPPGALLFFVVLVRIGLGSGIAAGLVVTVVAATTAVGVLVTMRMLGAEGMARRAAPFLVFGPAAIWQCVSGDAMFAAVAAWGMAALAVAAIRGSISWSVVAGVLLGYCVMLSYGLTLLGILAIAVLFLARNWRPLPIAALAALCVVLAFAVGGFAWWEGYSEIRGRYFEGVGGRRPIGYWMWGSLGALGFSAGPLVGSGMAMVVTNGRAYLAQSSQRVTAVLSGAGAAMILVATASLMSKAEVERIWLPFVPWMLLSCAFLPERWRRAGLALQLAVALVTMHLIKTTW